MNIRINPKTIMGLGVLVALILAVALVYAIAIQRTIPSFVVFGKVQTVGETLTLYSSLGPPLVELTEQTPIDFGKPEIDAFGNLITPVRVPVFVQNNGGTPFRLTVEATSVNVQPSGATATTPDPDALQVLFGRAGGVLRPAKDPEQAVIVQPGTGNRVAGELSLKLVKPPAQLGGPSPQGTKISFGVAFKAEAVEVGGNVAIACNTGSRLCSHSNESAFVIKGALDGSKKWGQVKVVDGSDINTVDKLANFSVVIIGGYPNQPQQDYQDYQDALKTWVEQGGGVVATGHALYEIPQHGLQNAAIGQLMPAFPTQTEWCCGGNINITDTSHGTTPFNRG